MYYRRDHTFDVKTCFQQTRYVFDVIVTSWALFVFCISWNFATKIASQISKRLEYLNISPSFFKKFNTSWNQNNTLTVMLLLKWSKIVWSKRSRYFLGTIQQIALTLWPKGVLCYALHTQTFDPSFVHWRLGV
jgi:hypothetical protein